MHNAGRASPDNDVIVRKVHRRLILSAFMHSDFRVKVSTYRNSARQRHCLGPRITPLQGCSLTVEGGGRQHSLDEWQAINAIVERF